MSSNLQVHRKTASPTGAKEKYRTIHNLTSILRLFNDFGIEERGVTEISKTLHMTPSTVSRMMEALEGEGFFERNPETGKYRLGIGFFELGIIYAFNFPLRKIIRPHVEQMAKEMALTASWGILKNSKIIVIDRVHNPSIDLFTYRMGLNIPIHSSSIGKVLLAHLPVEEQTRILKSAKMEKFTEATVTDLNLIKRSLPAVKDAGYAVDQGETYKDINCIAVPIKNGAGQVIAAINLMDEDSRSGSDKILGLSDYLKEKAVFISRQLGYIGYWRHG
jgi:IclR family transcriptional regulator, KDG regulon repressor